MVDSAGKPGYSMAVCPTVCSSCTGVNVTSKLESHLLLECRTDGHTDWFNVHSLITGREFLYLSRRGGAPTCMKAKIWTHTRYGSQVGWG